MGLNSLENGNRIHKMKENPITVNGVAAKDHGFRKTTFRMLKWECVRKT
jgi:hypothetical protein